MLYITAVCMFAHTFMTLLTFSSQLLHAWGRQVLVRGWARPHMDMMVISMRQEGLTCLSAQRCPL